jgi:hypothetical protein
VVPLIWRGEATISTAEARTRPRLSPGERGQITIGTARRVDPLGRPPVGAGAVDDIARDQATTALPAVAPGGYRARYRFGARQASRDAHARQAGAPCRRCVPICKRWRFIQPRTDRRGCCPNVLRSARRCWSPTTPSLSLRTPTGLLRQHFSRGTDHSVHSEDFRAEVATNSTNGPQKRFG